MVEEIREVVRQKYARAIKLKTGCCGSEASDSSCCGVTSSKVVEMITGNLYHSDEVKGLPAEALAASFGCGNPTALAELREGETVLDLGSGAGLDVLLSARRVGPTGKAYGLDMTDEMLAEARANQARAGVDNVEFIKGHLEDIPLPDNTVDVIISNCVINLSGDKDMVLQEAFRVLKHGGRFAVADIVLLKPLPREVQRDMEAWSGCVAGALGEDDYRSKLARAGFTDIDVEKTRIYDFSGVTEGDMFKNLTPGQRADLNGTVASAFIRAVKP